MSFWARMTVIAARIRTKVEGFAIHVSATAAVEFAMVLPVMLIIYLGSVGVGGGVIADRKLSNLALTLSNLTARANAAQQDSDLNDIFNASAAVLAPYDYTKAGMVVSSIVFDTPSPAGSRTPYAYVVWSTASGPGVTAMTPNCTNDLPATLVPTNIRSPGGSIVLAQAKFPYTPVVGYVVSGTINLSESDFMVPRNLPTVPRTDSTGTHTTCTNGKVT
jgi:Flp pilus assembly protein TadG